MGRALPRATRVLVAATLFVSFGVLFSGCAWLLGGIIGADAGFLSGQMTKSPETSAAAGGVAGAGAGALVGAAVGGPLGGAIAGGLSGAGTGYVTNREFSQQRD
ncbi:MAG TPA: hypothetical protein VFB33_00220 [Candidatus Binataceae bacterium]|jgi:hypothetical protein|nr:hypothetical protein [Candidatus Binataceae bacterium]